MRMKKREAREAPRQMQVQMAPSGRSQALRFFFASSDQRCSGTALFESALRQPNRFNLLVYLLHLLGRCSSTRLDKASNLSSFSMAARMEHGARYRGGVSRVSCLVRARRRWRRYVYGFQPALLVGGELLYVAPHSCLVLEVGIVTFLCVGASSRLRRRFLVRTIISLKDVLNAAVWMTKSLFSRENNSSPI